MPLWGNTPSMMTNAYMQEIERKRQLQKAELERQRQAESVRAMFQSLGIPMPQGNMQPQDARIVAAQKMQQQQELQAQQAKQAAEQQKFQAKKNAAQMLYGEDMANVNDPFALDAAIEMIETTKKTQKEAAKREQEMADWKAKQDYSRTGQKEYFDYTQAEKTKGKQKEQPTSLPYTPQMVEYVEKQLRDAAFGKVSIDDVMSDPSIVTIYEAVQKYDTDQFNEFEKLVWVAQKQKGEFERNANTQYTPIRSVTTPKRGISGGF